MTTTTVHPNQQRLRDWLDALLSGDPARIQPAWQAWNEPDRVLHIPGTGQVSGRFVGWDGEMGVTGTAYALTEGSLGLRVVDTFANDHRAVTILRVTGTRGDTTLDQQVVEVHELSDGRKVRESRLYPQDVTAYSAFFT